jgi:hypothetical protein
MQIARVADLDVVSRTEEHRHCSRITCDAFLSSLSPTKPRMPQVAVRRPFGELDLSDQLRFEPHAVFHLFLGQGLLRPLLLRQISKRVKALGQGDRRCLNI